MSATAPTRDDRAPHDRAPQDRAREEPDKGGYDEKEVDAALRKYLEELAYRQA